MRSLILILYLFVSACANVPPIIQSAPTVDLSIDEVLKNITGNRGKDIRWGGSIVKVRNEQNYTDIQLLYYPLNSYGRPDVEQSSQGRFIIHSQEFLDPAVYVEGKQVTVAGKLKGSVEHKVGNKSLTLPIVDAQEIYLWPKYRRPGYREYGYYPYRYDYYYPFSPFRYSGFRNRYPYRYRYCY